MKVIKLNTRYRKRSNSTHHFIAFVDDDDYELLREHRWCIQRGTSTFYAVSSTAGLMHRFITDFPESHVHHADGNGLNNTKDNLQIVSASEHLKIHRRGRGKYSFKKQGAALDFPKQGD